MSSSDEELRRKERLERARVYSRRRSMQNNQNEEDSDNQGQPQAQQERPKVSMGPLWLALVFAILKDILDLVGIGSLPLIGWLVTILIAIAIWFLVFISDAGTSNKVAKRFGRKIMTLLIGSGVEAFITGVNVFPIETITIIIIMAMAKAEEKGVLPDMEKIKKLSSG